MKETISVLSGQMVVVKESLATVKEENNHLKAVIETIHSALKQKGIIITVEGEMVTIDDGRNKTSSIRRSTKQTITKVEKDVS
jgi:dihydroxyacid dehydratase/phosphogluconate dehydratase